MLLAVGLLRFALDLPEARVQALLADGWQLPLSQSTVSRLSIEFLLRWKMLMEVLLPSWTPGLGPIILQMDGTRVAGGPTTFRAREALKGPTLWAEQLTEESIEEVVRFLEAYRDHYGTPALILRDQSGALKKAVSTVFPGVPQGEDHYHFLDDLGRVVMPDYEPLRESLIAHGGLARLAEWSRRLPREGKKVEEVERVAVRMVLEWIEEARIHPGGFPWRLAYAEVVRRMEKAGRWARAMVAANASRRLFVREVVGLPLRLEELLQREGVRVAWSRLVSEEHLWEEIRGAMRAERTRRGKVEFASLATTDVAEVKRAIGESLTHFAGRGEWAEAIVARTAKRFEEHEPFLWVEAPGLKAVVRSTVELERAHREDRQGVRHRRGQADTQREMGLLGSLLAFWSNARCPWLIEEGWKGLNLWEAFANQDPQEVRRRMLALPKEGRRPRVLWRRAEETEELAGELLRVLQGEGRLESGLSRWMGRIKGTGLVDGL